MHELAVTQMIIEAVTSHAGAAQVSCVRLRVGVLSGVVPRALQFCFEIVAAGTTLQGAELVVVEQLGVGHCGACDTSFHLADLVLLCPCGSVDVIVTAGRELTIESIEVN
jgi:hydrogenase nickel incorporation protein HypA/HybF